ncbi:MAG: CDP-glycerol glycerophosphotransferase family protein [Arcobacteraceae bacterium]
MIKNCLLEKHSRILIAPYSSMSKTFKNYIENKSEINFLGFIDSNKSADEIFKIETIPESFDYIFIVSPNYGVAIYNQYIQQGINKNQIKIIDYQNGFIVSSTFKLQLKTSIKNISLSIQNYLYTHFKTLFENPQEILFIAPDFIDINIKELYLYCDKQNDFRITIATNNKNHCKIFKQKGFNVILYPSIQFIYYALKSKIKILDHSPIEKEVLLSLKNSKSIQIWHGIALKKIGHLTNYKNVEYDVLVSTSSFVSEYSFAQLFKFKKIVNSGYPRNDLLVNKSFDSKSLVLVDDSLYTFLKALCEKIFVYMPTWRPDNTITNPIDLVALNHFAKEHNIFILIKTHPFTREDSFYDSTLDTSNYSYHQNYDKNILFYPTTDDIYPILSFSSGLITDYSSVYFDYLLLDKPIIFFVYDKEYYIKFHGDFMLDFDEYTPGDKPETFEELKLSLLHSLNHDSFKEKRERIKNQLFENQDGSSCKLLYDEIKNLVRE